MVQLLHRLARRVVDVLAVLDRPGIDPEQRHVAHVRLRDRLEHLRDERPAVFGLQRQALGASPPLRLDRRLIARRGDELDQLRQQRPRAECQLCGAAEEGEELALQHPRLHRGDRFVPTDLLASQIALEQRVVRFRDPLDQLLRVALEPLPILSRDVDLVVLTRFRAFLVQVALLREQVDDPVERGAFAHRNLHRDHLGCEPLLDLPVHLLEVRVLFVHEGHEEQPGNPPLVGIVPDLFRADFHATRGGDHDHRPIRRADAGERLAGEIQVARRIDQVELGIHPFGDGESQVDGVLAFDLVGGVIGEGSAVFHGAVAFARAGHEREGIDQRGLPARAVADDRHVADLTCLVHAHGRSSLRQGIGRICGDQAGVG